MTEQVPGVFLKVLADLSAWLANERVPSLVVGGVAASILGRPRATRDIDGLAFIADERWATILNSASRYGIGARIEQPLEFARRTRVLLLRHTSSGIDIDLILGRLPFEETAIAQGVVHDLAGVSVKLPRVEDLIIMKAIARRPHDLRDIEGLLDAHPEADVEYARAFVRDFAAAAELPGIVDDFEKLLAGQRRLDR